MNIFGDPIVRDLRRIRKLASKVHDLIEEGDTDDAKKKVKKIIRLTIDKYKRVHSRFSSDEVLLKEIATDLQNGKKALRDLDSFQMFEEAKQLMDLLVKFQEHELIEVHEDEKREDEIYDSWQKFHETEYLYHGTTTISLDKIKKYGLSSELKPWDSYDLERLGHLFEKGGGYNPIKGRVGLNSRIFLATDKKYAENYANQKPEVFTTFIPEKIVKNKDKNKGLLYVYSSIVKKVTNSEWDKAERLFYSDKKEFNLFIENHSGLKKSEIKECIKMFNKYWSILISAKGLVLTISMKAPAISEAYKGFSKFEKFKGDFKKYLESHKIKYDNSNLPYDYLFRLKQYYEPYQLKDRIPSKYIVKYEYV